MFGFHTLFSLARFAGRRYCAGWVTVSPRQENGIPVNRVARSGREGRSEHPAALCRVR